MKSRLFRRPAATLENLPVELHHVIADELDLESAKRLSATSKSFFFSLSEDAYFKPRLAMIEELSEELIQVALATLKSYIKTDKTHPGYGCFPHVKYDKGYHRACCFMDILSNDFLSFKFRIFVLYALLHEKNGTHLKIKMMAHLRAAIDAKDDIIKLIAAYTSFQYKGHLETMQNILLNKIHGCYQIYSDNNYYLGDPPRIYIYTKESGEDYSIETTTLVPSEDKRIACVNNYWGRLEEVMNKLSMDEKPNSQCAMM